VFTGVDEGEENKLRKEKFPEVKKVIEKTRLGDVARRVEIVNDSAQGAKLRPQPPEEHHDAGDPVDPFPGILPVDLIMPRRA